MYKLALKVPAMDSLFLAIMRMQSIYADKDYAEGGAQVRRSITRLLLALLLDVCPRCHP